MEEQIGTGKSVDSGGATNGKVNDNGLQRGGSLRVTKRRTFTQGKLALFLRKNYFLVFLSCATIIVGLSWYRAWYAGTLIVDGFNLNGLSETLGFICYFVPFLTYCFTYYLVWNNNGINFKQVKRLAYMLAVIFSFMLPMLSNDVFSLITYGDAANKGLDVYTNTHALFSSVYFPYVSKFWQTAPCVYGPVVLIGARVAAWFGNGNMMLALVAYKVIALLWAILFIEIAAQMTQMFATSPRKLFFILLSPFFMLQGLAQLHCDGIAATLALCGVYFVFTQRWYVAFAFGALCVAVKINYVLILPFLLMALYLKTDGWMTFIRRASIALFIYVAAFVLVYSGVYTSPDTFTVMFRFVFDRAPAKSLAELIGGAIYYVPHVIHGDHQAIQDGLIGKISAEQVTIWNTVKTVSQLLAVATSAYILFKFITGKRELQQWFRVYVRLLLLFMLVYTHIFFAWYLIMFIPFMWMVEDPEFMQWLFVLSFLVNMQDIVCALSRNSTVYFFSFALTVLSILAYVWKFRKVYVKSLGY